MEGSVANTETGEPLPGVNVTLEGTERGTATGADGRFVLENVEPGGYTIVASSVGYESARREIRVRRGATTRLDIQLSTSTAELSEVVVQGQRGGFVTEDVSAISKIGAPRIEMPQSVSVLTQAEMEVRDVDRLAEALRYAPGVQGETFGFEPRLPFLRFRGFDATTTGLYRDGLQLRNPGFSIGYNPEPYGTDRIEVLRGPASVLYGAGNPGGLVNFVSKKPTQQPQGEIVAEVGQYNHYEGKLDVSGPIDEGGTFAYRLTSLVRESDTQVDYINNDRVFVAPAFTWRPTETTTLTLLGRYQRDNTRASQRLPASGTLSPNPNGEIPVDRFLGEPDVDRYERRQGSVGYLFEQEAGDALRFQQKLRYYTVDLEDVTVYGSTLQEGGEMLNRNNFESFGELDGFVLDNQAQADVTTGPVDHTLLLGLDYQNVNVGVEENFGSAPAISVVDPEYGADVPEPEPFGDTETEQHQIGVYLQDHFTVFDRLVATLNGRFDWAGTETTDHLADSQTDQDDSAFSGRAGLVYRSAIGLAPYASYSESFLPAIGTDAEGKPFDPERGQQYEVGAKYQPPGANAFVTVALFDLTRENFLQTDPETFQQVQTGEANSQGFELEGAASLAFGLDLTASLTLQDVEITESVAVEEEGERPTQVREEMASFWADYTLDEGLLSGFGVGGGVRYLGPSYGDVPNTLKAPGVTLVDATAHYDFGDFRLRVNVDNLLNEKYVASTFVSGSQDFATYGIERTFSVSLGYRW